jgi:hypothetical protein
LAELERKARDADDWQKVNQRNQAALESYLRSEPAQDDTSAVLSVISRFASAWNTKDVDSILAIQRTLKKRTVKAELARVKELNVRISPASRPQIEGSQAVVLCRRQASQVLSNGAHKQMPETIVSYVLEKHDGNWTIEGMR